MSALVDIMDGLAEKLTDAFEAVDIGSGITVQVVGRLETNPTPPAIDIYPRDPSADEQGAGFGDIHGALYFTVRARVSTGDHEAGQDLLLAFMDSQNPLSVAAALGADSTLAGLASSVMVDGPSGYTRYVDPDDKGKSLLGCDWRVTVINLPAPPPS